MSGAARTGQKRSRRQRGILAAVGEALRSPRNGLGFMFSIALVSAAGLYGAMRGGQYDEFIAQYGNVRDIVARNIGFNIEAVTMSGQSDLSEPELLALAGIGPKTSLIFLDAATVRARLTASPFIKEASVRKLYPNRVVINIVEREAFALWQKDGKVFVIARDGVVIDEMRDDRFAGRPFVVGEEANTRIGEYLALLDSAVDLKDKVRAGMLVAGRRWTFKMNSGVDIKLPEADPRAALQTLARLERETRILDKDVLSLDLREPGRIIARMSEEGMASRADVLARKAAKGKGSQT